MRRLDLHSAVEREDPTTASMPGPGDDSRGQLPRDLRCACGNLLARLLRGEVTGLIEFKCRRCRRLVQIGQHA